MTSCYNFYRGIGGPYQTYKGSGAKKSSFRLPHETNTEYTRTVGERPTLGNAEF